MTTSRAQHTATLLADGRVLVSGGTANFQALASEIFNPATGTWTAVGSMGTARRTHSAALLNDGTVLVVGGDPAVGSTSELFNPTMGTWTGAGSLPAVQDSPFSATLLGSGQVLVAGGNMPDATGNAVPTASAALFTPGATPAATLSTLTLNPASVTAGTSSQGTVTLTGAAPAGGASVSLSSSNPAVASVPPSVTVQPGATSAAFTITTALVSATTSVTISASLDGVSNTAGLTVVQADRVAIKLAQYDVAKRVLSVQATSSSTRSL